MECPTEARHTATDKKDVNVHDISFFHSPVFCPNDPSHTSSFDNQMAGLMGNNNAPSIVVAPPTTGFIQSANQCCFCNQPEDMGGGATLLDGNGRSTLLVEVFVDTISGWSHPFP